MSKNNNSNGKNGASDVNAQVDVNDLIKRLNDLTQQVKGVVENKTTPTAPTTPAKRGRKATPKATTPKAEPKAEKWDTVGKASESVEDAVAFQHRISVQVQKSSENRTQVHIYSQVLVPADKIRASTKGLDKAKAKTNDGKTVDAYWLNQRNPLIIRGNQKESVAFLTALIENAQ